MKRIKRKKSGRKITQRSHWIVVSRNNSLAAFHNFLIFREFKTTKAKDIRITNNVSNRNQPTEQQTKQRPTLKGQCRLVLVKVIFVFNDDIVRLFYISFLSTWGTPRSGALAFASSSSKAKTRAPNLRFAFTWSSQPTIIMMMKKDGNSESRFLCFQVNILFDVLRALPLIDHHGHRSIWCLNRKIEEVRRGKSCVCIRRTTERK